MAVELDVGELDVLQWSCVRSRASCSLGASKIESPQAIPQGEGERERIESTCFLRLFSFLATRVLWLACGVHFAMAVIDHRPGDDGGAPGGVDLHLGGVARADYVQRLIDALENEQEHDACL